MRVVVTGAKGLIGSHAHTRLHAINCAARFNGKKEPFEIVALDREQFENDAELRAALSGAHAVLHFAGVNRAADNIVEAANPEIAKRLVSACIDVGTSPHLVYANSTHSQNDTPYGRSKRVAGEIFAAHFVHYTNLVLPHIFGEGAKPFYNNVTATLIEKIQSCKVPDINPDGRVQLLHAGEAAQIAINAITNSNTGIIEPAAYPISVPDLYEKLLKFHTDYQVNIYPDLTRAFDRNLFNCYRAATYPEMWPRDLKLNSDERGTLFEAVKGGGGGQCFLSTTLPGVTRGDHFHLHKVERFLVVQGDAIIRIRKVLTDEVWEYCVTGKKPTPIDMPTLHSHSIENVGKGELLTLFWSNDLFDPTNPDTFADTVLK